MANYRSCVRWFDRLFLLERNWLFHRHVYHSIELAKHGSLWYPYGVSHCRRYQNRAKTVCKQGLAPSTISITIHTSLMKHYLIFTAILLAFSFTACKKEHNATSLSAKEFAEKIKEDATSLILDVRTPEEFSKGHLENAQNIDINGADFSGGIAKLDKTTPVFVYCLSGGRSASAAAQMRSEGFTKVYELEGGIMKWRAENLPETTNNASSAASTVGMTAAQFDALLNDDRLVLVDVYADWCGPCQKMKPSLDAIATEKARIVKLVRINADDNEELCSTLKIDALPTLLLYKKKRLIWSNVGFIEKDMIEAALQSK